MKHLILWVGIISIVHNFGSVYAQDASEHKNLWYKSLKRGELRIWSTWDARTFIGQKGEDKQRVKKIWIEYFDSLVYFEDTIMIILKKNLGIKELRISGFKSTPAVQSSWFSKFTDFPPDSLEILQIIQCKFNLVNINAIKKFNRLRILDLWSDSISDIEPILRVTQAIPSLGTINFRNNPIKELPPIYTLYGNLKIIGLSYTEISNIPCEILLQSNLIGVGIENTRIEILPSCLKGTSKCILIKTTTKIKQKNRKLIKSLSKNCG